MVLSSGNKPAGRRDVRCDRVGGKLLMVIPVRTKTGIDGHELGNEIVD